MLKYVEFRILFVKFWDILNTKEIHRYKKHRDYLWLCYGFSEATIEIDLALRELKFNLKSFQMNKLICRRMKHVWTFFKQGAVAESQTTAPFLASMYRVSSKQIPREENSVLLAGDAQSARSLIFIQEVFF